MSKIIALGAYVYQAVLAFGLLIAVARLLAATDYAAYSVFIASTQLGAIAAFEWIRFSCSRFYPGLTAESEQVQRKTMLFEAGICAMLCFAGAVCTVPFGAPFAVAMVGGGVAVFQGGSDLHLSIVRFGGRFGDFSRLQGARATLLAFGTIGGAALTHTLLGAILGSVAGYAIYAGMAMVMDRQQYAPGGRWSAEVVRAHLSYGSVSAGMSVLGLLSPLGLKLILTAALSPAASAGVLLALDLLQRPFVLVVSALQAIQYPDVVAAFDRKDRTFARTLGQFYGLLITLSLVAAAGIFVLLRPIADIAVTPELRPAFLLTAPLVALFALLRSITQNVSTTPAHLTLNLRDLTLLAVIDCLSFNLLAWVASLLFPAAPLPIVAGAALGALLTSLYGWRVAAALPSEVPWPPLLMAVLATLIAAAMFFAPAGDALVGTMLAGVAAGTICLAALLALLFAMRRGGGPAREVTAA